MVGDGGRPRNIGAKAPRVGTLTDITRRIKC